MDTSRRNGSSVRTPFNGQSLVNCFLHVRTLCKRVFGYRPGRIDEFLGDEAHPVRVRLFRWLLLWVCETLLVDPLVHALDNVFHDLVFPQIVDDAVSHSDDNIIFLDLYAIHDGVLFGGVRAIRAELSRTIKPVPLLGRLEDDLFIPGADDKYLRVTELCNVQYGMRGIVGVGAEQSSAGGSSSIPLIWLRSRLLGLFEGLFEVGNRVWFVPRVIAGLLYLEGPEVEDEPGPEPIKRSANDGL